MLHWNRHIIPSGHWGDEKEFYWLMDTDKGQHLWKQHIGTMYVFDSKPEYVKQGVGGISYEEALMVVSKMEELRKGLDFDDEPTTNPEST